MKDLKKKYGKIVAKRKGVIEQINVLLEDEAVQKYIELSEQNDWLSEKENILYESYKQMKFKDYSSCNHIWVNTLKDSDEHNYCGCIKCGLDKRVCHPMVDYNDLTSDKKIMYDFINENSTIDNIINLKSEADTKLSCDLNLGKAIYSKIKEVYPNVNDENAVKYLELALKIKETHPDINDRTTLKYLELALNIKEAHPDIDDETTGEYLDFTIHNIIDTQLSNEQKSELIKMLLLKPEFNKCNDSDTKSFKKLM